MKPGSNTATGPAAAGPDAVSSAALMPSTAKAKRIAVSDDAPASGGEALGGFADDFGEGTGCKGRDQPGGPDQLLERRRAAAPAQRDIGFEGRLVVLQRLDPELHRA